MLIYINFSFDFLGLDYVDFENYFANELIKMGRFLSYLKHSRFIQTVLKCSICNNDWIMTFMHTAWLIDLTCRGEIRALIGGGGECE